ncbi:hypothetical protein EDD90_8938 [Streptomyces sp. Ag109_O5-1]|uniref:DUF7825 domain-containing protein n=1 Tax=Streptomyces sp. Ag109_O5-1 TaxID=1938851 RepID=UPI000F4D6076|nr:DUF6493 family protein [Streptomyces sp. Ag109_O5-1]RPE45648.1 hypothetical protein EDD90_8938 [Streptomyces sp. Ag109_O5-1]
MSAVLEAVRAGRAGETALLVKKLTDAERRALLPELQDLRKELRAAPWETPAQRSYPALQVAGAMCHSGAAAAATWIAGADMRWRQAPAETLLKALADRGTGWQADVARRLAARPVSADVSFELMAGLVRRSGCEVPVTDAYVVGWVRHIGHGWGRVPLVDRLRAEPDLTPLVNGLFELSDLGEVRWLFGDGPGSWQSALAELARTGTLDRKVIVDGCVARLLRGGGPTDHRVFLPLLVQLALTRGEELERVADWTALARDAVSPVAAHAQSVLAALALDGELTARQLAEASEGLLFRAEKKLVRAQLVLLGKVLTREAASTAQLLPAVAQAFGHEDTQVQERALKLVERHVKRLTEDSAAQADIADAAEQLSPALRVRAAAALGIAPASAPEVYEEVLPPAPEPFRLAPAPDSAVELAEEVSALLASDGDVAAFERALDGLARHAHRDQDALREALEPVAATRWWQPDSSGRRYAEEHFDHNRRGLLNTSNGLDLILATLSGEVSTAALFAALQRGPADHDCARHGFSRVIDVRFRELAYRIRTDPQPLLLATPSWSTGLLEPGDLVDRLEAYRRLDARVGDVDFAQALLRVRREDRTAALAAAGRASELGTPEGERLARWLAAGEPALPTSDRRTSGPRVLIESGEVLDLRADFPEAFRRLGRPFSVSDAVRYCYHWGQEDHQHWLATLPESRELVAVRLVHDLSEAALDDQRGMAAALPLLAESGGVAGEATQLCVAYGLGARHPEDRLAAVDALLVLAARGQLDAARLGADLGQLVQRGAVKPSRLAESARTAVATGANTTIWEMLRHTLPVLLADLATAGTGSSGSVRGLGELLSIAAECAERSGARGDMPHLAQAAARRGSSRLVVQARRLLAALAEEAAA